MNFITSTAGSSAGFLFPRVAQQLGYVISYKSNLDKLKTEVQRLTEDSTDKQRIVEDARKRGEDIAATVKSWLDRVEAAIADANKLINEDSEGRGEVRCLYWPFPNPCLRRTLSKEAEEMAQRVSKIMAEGKFEIYSFPVPTQMTVPPSARGYEALLSRTTMLDEIKLALEDPNIYMIGVHGMGGVGKTTLVKELEWKAKEEGSFGAVVRATITNTPNLRRIQGQLADGLGLNLRSETEEGRAGELRGRISTKKSILVILDDIWGELDLAELGIPCGDEHKGCKLVLTSRDLNVLKSKMDTQKDFTLDVLLEEESWNLFKKMAGDVVKHHSIKPIAVDVAKCCFGLPLLIITVAKALRKKEDVWVWKDSLKRLQRFDLEELLIDKVRHSLKFSYDRLESEEQKSLFLFIGSFELDGIHTEDLLRYCWGLGLYKNVYTLAEARNRQYTLVNDLRASSLLLDGETEWVRMHDLVHEVAKSIASRTHPTYTMQSFTDINEWPKMDELQKYHHIILPDYRLSELPEKLECPKLKLLVFHCAANYLKVPDNFFTGMKGVKVLYLRGMKFTKPLTLSLHLLANLRQLNLSGSEVEDIAIVGKLTSLELLIIGYVQTIELPKEIGHLTQLRMLKVSRCHVLRLIPKYLLSNLKCLEELYIGYCYIQWEVEGSNNESNYASLGELRSLNVLTTLELTIKDGSILPMDLHNFAKLERYDLCIGLYRPISYDSEASRLHYLQGSRFGPKFSRSLRLRGSSNILWNDGVKVLLTRVEDLYLAELEGVRDILPGLNTDGFMELRSLCVTRSAGLLHIINSEWHHLHHAFPSLENLELDNLNNMEEICHGPLPTRSFHMLKVIKVNNCNKLKNLLLWSHVMHLYQLHEIEISECESMKEIIAEEIREEIHETENLVLPELHSLSLKSLPMLLRFCSIPSTIDIAVVPLALIDGKVAMPNLKTMGLFGINTCKIWDDNLPAHSFVQNLTSLTIKECVMLTSLFPSSVTIALVKLQYLEISSCQTLEKIFVQEENQGNHHSTLNLLSSEQDILPNLKRLVISKLDNLELLWHSQVAPNSFCKLNEMDISKCPKLLNVFPSYVLNNLKNLETLKVSECDELGAIFEIQELSTVTPNQQGLATRLTTLDLDDLPKLKYIWSKDPRGILRFQNLCNVEVQSCEGLSHAFPISVAEELQQLQELNIRDCGIENIVEKSDNGEIKRVYVECLDLNGCHRLRTVVPTSVAFHTLDELEVWNCDGLVNIMTASTATSLSKLRALKIYECGMIEEIVASENGGDAASDIAFMKLEVLELYCLGRLKSFCKGSCSLKFPSLQTVRVRHCPLMETFCSGNLTAPSVTMVATSWPVLGFILTNDEPRWDGDLNATIGNIFNERLA